MLNYTEVFHEGASSHRYPPALPSRIKVSPFKGRRKGAKEIQVPDPQLHPRLLRLAKAERQRQDGAAHRKGGRSSSSSRTTWTSEQLRKHPAL